MESRGQLSFQNSIVVSIVANVLLLFVANCRAKRYLLQVLKRITVLSLGERDVERG